MGETLKHRAGVTLVFGCLAAAAVLIAMIAVVGQDAPVQLTIFGIAGVFLAAAVAAGMNLIKSRPAKTGRPSPMQVYGVLIISGLISIGVEAYVVLAVEFGAAEVGKGTLGVFGAMVAAGVATVVAAMFVQRSKDKAEDDAAEQKAKQDAARQEQAEFRREVKAALDDVKARLPRAGQAQQNDADGQDGEGHWVNPRAVSELRKA